ncbi:MAG: hypothetical protein ACXAC7_07230 [Candidatus Hodarchaeales archaeon]|jgi:hypothetical protein
MGYYFKLCLFLILTFSFLISSVSLAQFPSGYEGELEYRVRAGDSQTYEFKKYYYSNDNAPSPPEMIDENGEVFNYTVQKGKRFKIIIAAINISEDDSGRQQAFMKIEINGRKSQESRAYSYIWPTTDNRSYWDLLVNSTSERGSIEGNVATIFSGNNQSYLEYKININTGWLISIYTMSSFDNGTLSYEVLIEGVSSEGLFDIPINFVKSFSPELIVELFVLFVGGGILVTVIKYRGQPSQRSSRKLKRESEEKTGFVPQAPHTDVIKNLDVLISELDD